MFCGSYSTKLTGGPFGISGIPRPIVFGLDTFSSINYLFFTLLVAGMSLFVIYRIVKSPFGRVIEAIRDDELAAKILGKNSFKVKSLVFMVSAFFAGVAGSLYTHYLSFIDPFSFTFFQLIPVFLIVIVGGVASLKGTLVATVLIIFFQELLKFLDLPLVLIGPSEQIIFATLLLLVLHFKPRGLFGQLELD